MGSGSIPNFPEDPVKHFANVGHLVYLVLNLVWMLSVALAVIFLIFGGIQYVASGGDEKGITSARKRITGAIIGFLIAVSAWSIRYLIIQAICTDPIECQKLIGG